LLKDGDRAECHRATRQSDAIYIRILPLHRSHMVLAAISGHEEIYWFGAPSFRNTIVLDLRRAL